MSEKWSSEDILHFLNVYEKYDILWNTHLAGYRDKTAREIALRNLLRELKMEGLTLDIVRNKIKMVKTVYNQERNKILKSRNTSAGQNGYVYKPKLAWFAKADSFLKDVSSTRNITFKKEIEDTNEEEHFEENETEKNLFYLEEENKRPKNRMPIKKQLARKIPGRAVLKTDVRKRQNTDIVNNALNKLKRLADTVNKEEDEFDHFGKYIACQMRQLPIINALHCQEQILSIITQERVATLQQAELEAASSSHWDSNKNDF